MEAYSITDIGVQRKVNQDYVFCRESAIGSLPNFFAVADGMGGHKAGDFASRYCMEILLKQIGKSQLKSPVSILEEAINVANESLHNMALDNEELEGMGTTLVAATIIDHILYVANVGDSRLYVIKDQIKQITEDHSLVEVMIKTGEIERKEAVNHPGKHIITRALGTQSDVRADFFEVDLMGNEYILLCSDGLTNMLVDEEIMKIILDGHNVKETAECLIEAANLSGGKDNIGIVIVHV
ncbi:Stp1/IreP family PP2C-type Ser/Thr phosphatase [Anaeromicropila populeti]|uniref:Protein phosphatase n=1 Tax=Anaeromicropila populeti TaxID=37658 RepID=A0A1I6KXG4_9FIRM|nr:Stp1/IreP family PP2C-type Ser/Thr phosphatase [Anaeromicropila populeti]SFR95620.1 protein phosphatase [Anaeromicropila populeti]